MNQDNATHTNTTPDIVDPVAGEILNAPVSHEHAKMDGAWINDFDAQVKPAYPDHVVTDTEIKHSEPMEEVKAIAADASQTTGTYTEPVLEYPSLGATAASLNDEDGKVKKTAIKEPTNTKRLLALLGGLLALLALAGFMVMKLFSGQAEAPNPQKNDLTDINVPAKPVRSTMFDSAPAGASAPMGSASMPDASPVVPPVVSTSLPTQPLPPTSQVPASSPVVPEVAASAASQAALPNNPVTPVVPTLAPVETKHASATTSHHVKSTAKAIKNKRHKKRGVIRKIQRHRSVAVTRGQRFATDTSLSELRLVSVFPKTGPNKQAWIRSSDGSIHVVKVGERIGGATIRFIDGDALVVETTGGSIQ